MFWTLWISIRNLWHYHASCVGVFTPHCANIEWHPMVPWLRITVLVCEPKQDAGSSGNCQHHSSRTLGTYGPKNLCEIFVNQCLEFRCLSCRVEV